MFDTLGAPKEAHAVKHAAPEADFIGGLDAQVDTWDVRTLADAFKPRPPLEYVIEGLFPLPSLSIVFGAPGTLKSLLLGSAALHVVAGETWIGRTVKQYPAMWLDVDNGKRRTAERFEALARYLGLKADAPFTYYSMPNPMFNAGNDGDIELMKGRMLSRGTKFLIIDNLGMICPGADENSDAMVKVMGNLRMLAEQTGGAVVVIHHQRKSTGTGVRKGETLRGHSSIEAALDLALLVEREDHSTIVAIRSTKTRDVDVYPFGAEWLCEHKSGSNELLEAGFASAEIENDSSDLVLEKAIIKVAGESAAINQTTLKDRVCELTGRGKNKVLEMIGKLEKKRVLKYELGPRGGKLYHVD